MAANDQYQGADPFGGTGGYASTGAPGTQGVMQAEGDARLAEVDITPNYGGPPYRVRVGVGDTGAFADDQAAHSSPLLPGDASQYVSTPPTGSTGARNPNAATVPSVGDQLRSVRRS